MTLVYPILLGGLALLAVPILIHLIFRQKPRTLKFPAFRFLMQRSRTNLRKLRLRHLFLLALRMLILALICLALARPKVSGDLLNLQTDRPVAAVFLFDTSYSMQYRTTSDRTRLDEAREQALRLLETLHPESRVIVLDTAEPAAAARAEWVKRDKAEVDIKALALRYDNHPVTRRLDDAYQLLSKLALVLDDDLGRRLPRVLCAFSDRTEASWDRLQLAYLQSAADGIPPLLEQLVVAQAGIAGRVALLKDLRRELPPLPAQDYPEQSLIAHWEELRDKIPSATWENYPGTEWTRLLGQIRAESRDLLQKLQARDESELTPAARTFRTRLLDALHDGLREVQGVSSLYVDVGLDDASDLGIAAIDFFAAGDASAPRQTFAAREKFRVQALVRAAGADFDNTLTCEVDGKPYRKQMVQVKKGESKPFFFDLDAGDLSTGYHQVEVRLSSADQLEFTNHRFATLLIRPARQVLMITDDRETAEPLKRYIEGNPRVQFQCALQGPTEAEKLGPGLEGLAKYQAVYLLNVATPSPTLWKALKDYVAQGGSLAVVPGGVGKGVQSMLEAYREPTALALLPGEIRGQIEVTPELLPPAEGEAKDRGAVWDWNDSSMYQHPFLKQFQRWKDIGRDDFIQVPRYAYRFWDVAPSKGGSVLVWYNTKAKKPAVLEREFGKGQGKVVLLTTRLDFPVDPAWNNYLEHTNSWFLVLPGELTIYLAGDLERKALNFIVGQAPAAVTIPPGVSDPAFLLRGPIREELVPRPEKTNELLLRKAVVPGNYVVEAKQAPNNLASDMIGAVSVNLPAEEGSLTRLPPADIEALLGRDALRNLRPGDAVVDLPGLFSTPHELLPALMVALLLILALENLLANLFYRRQPGPPAAQEAA